MRLIWQMTPRDMCQKISSLYAPIALLRKSCRVLVNIYPLSSMHQSFHLCYVFIECQHPVRKSSRKKSISEERDIVETKEEDMDTRRLAEAPQTEEEDEVIDPELMFAARGLFDFDALEQHQLPFRKHSALLVLPSANTEWWPAAKRSEDGEELIPGYVPRNYVAIAEEEDFLEDLPERVTGRRSRRAVCKYDFVGSTKLQLSFSKGTLLRVCPVETAEWWFAWNPSTGESGNVPKNFLRFQGGAKLRHQSSSASLTLFETSLSVLGCERPSALLSSTHVNVLSFDDGAKLVDETMNVGALYVLRKGRVEMVQDGKVVATVEEGRWFGTEAFDKPTSVICRSHVQLFSIPLNTAQRPESPAAETGPLVYLSFLRSQVLRMDCILRMPAQMRNLAILRCKMDCVSPGDVQRILQPSTLFLALLITSGNNATVIVDGGRLLGWDLPEKREESSAILITMDRRSHNELITLTKEAVGTEEVDVYKRLSGHPLFRMVPPLTAQHLSIHITMKTFRPGERVTDEAHFFIIYSGYVTLEACGRQAQVHDFFGHLPFLDLPALRNQKTRAGSTGCTCFSLPPSTVGELLTLCPQVKNTLVSSLRPRWSVFMSDIEEDIRDSLPDWICNPLSNMIRIMAKAEKPNMELSEVDDEEALAALKVWNAIGTRMRPALNLLTNRPQFLNFSIKDTTRFRGRTLAVEVSQGASAKVDLIVHVEQTLAELIKDYTVRRGASTAEIYVAKLLNHHVFFLYKDIPLYHYKHFRDASLLSDTQAGRIQLELLPEKCCPPPKDSFKSLMRSIRKSYEVAQKTGEHEPEPEPEPEDLPIPSHTVSWPVRVRLLDTTGLDVFEEAEDFEAVFVRLEIVSCGAVLDFQQSRVMTVPKAAGYVTLDSEWIYFNRTISTLTPSARICATLYAMGDPSGDGASRERVLAGGSFQLFDHCRCLRAGTQTISLWPSRPAERILFCAQNPELDAPTLRLHLDHFATGIQYNVPPVPPRALNQTPLQPQSAATQAVLTKDPLEQYRISLHERREVWKDRASVLTDPTTLPLVLFCADWSNRNERGQALALLEGREDLPAAQALELLDRHHGDPKVREFAVERLEALDDNALAEYLLQLVQVLKYEPYHNSALAGFLLRRAFRNPLEIGQKLFWSLLAEVHRPATAQRFSLILRSFYANCGSLRIQLCKQFDQQTLLKAVARAMLDKRIGSKSERTRYCRRLLREVNAQMPEWTVLCMDPTVAIGKLLPDKCKVMNSKKRPLWLAYEPYEQAFTGLRRQSEPVLIMFKAGDDLRQDQMTLQLLRFMNRVWLESGLDLKLTPYQCVTTGYELGMLEIVKESETTANIQVKYGGKFGALQKNTLLEWLKENSKGEEGMAKSRENFVRSCAGYCVATYVLGIGDRHSDNIMLSKAGRLFHIDFGHFLGHFKSKFGVKRERTAFVFTKEMAFVMGGKGDPQYQVFVKLCCEAYNCLRAHKTELVRLFSLMIPAGMPELVDDRCIDYLTQKLCISKTDKLAAEAFRKEINTCLADTYRRIDNFIHNWKVS